MKRFAPLSPAFIGGAITLVGGAIALGYTPTEAQDPCIRIWRVTTLCRGNVTSAVASGRIQVKPLITAVSPLEDGPRWFERLYFREPNLMKVILIPGAPE
jgi:L-iditol 2-dehydrogenase